MDMATATSTGSKKAAMFPPKIAAAIAVLRNKPTGISARQYTEELCAKYLQAQTQWRSRYLQTHDALVCLKQQQAVWSTQIHQGSAAGGDHCPPTPPSSTGDADSAHPSVHASHQILMSSYQFIHSVVNLSRKLQMEGERPHNQVDVSASNRSATTPPDSASLDSLLAETVPTCARHLRTVVSRGDADVSTNCVLQGLDGLVLLLNSGWMDSNGCHLRLLLAELGGLVDDLLQRLFEPETNIFQPTQARRLLHQMLLHLTTKMRVPEKYSLLHSLVVRAKTLCCLISSNTAARPACYECLALALDCIQQGVMSLKLVELHLDSLRELQQEMERIVDSSLIHRFPLVTNTVLRLTAVIEACAKSETG